MYDFTTTTTIDAPLTTVHAAILDTRSWWNSDIHGSTSTVGDEFGFEVTGLHRTRMRITDITPERIEWLVVDNAFGFVTDQSEWIGDRLEFELSESADGRTTLTFTQRGLHPDLECYDVCSNAWTFFVRDSLRELAEHGLGKPESAGADTTDVPRDDFFAVR